MRFTLPQVQDRRNWLIATTVGMIVYWIEVVREPSITVPLVAMFGTMALVYNLLEVRRFHKEWGR